MRGLTHDIRMTLNGNPDSYRLSKILLIQTPFDGNLLNKSKPIDTEAKRFERILKRIINDFTK